MVVLEHISCIFIHAFSLHIIYTDGAFFSVFGKFNVCKTDAQCCDVLQIDSHTKWLSHTFIWTRAETLFAFLC